MCQIFCLINVNLPVPFFYHSSWCHVMCDLLYVRSRSVFESLKVSLWTSIHQFNLFKFGPHIHNRLGSAADKASACSAVTGEKKQGSPLHTDIHVYSPGFHLGGRDGRSANVSLAVNFDLPNKKSTFSAGASSESFMIQAQVFESHGICWISRIR